MSCGSLFCGCGYKPPRKSSWFDRLYCAWFGHVMAHQRVPSGPEDDGDYYDGPFVPLGYCENCLETIHE